MPEGVSDTSLFPWIVRILLAWSLVSLGTSVVGLYARPRELYRGFWFMSGLWGLIDGVIGLAGLFQKPIPADELQSILGMNALLDIFYLITGFVLMTRSNPVLKGFGIAILVQGVFLSCFDVTFYFLCKP